MIGQLENIVPITELASQQNSTNEPSFSSEEYDPSLNGNQEIIYVGNTSDPRLNQLYNLTKEYPLDCAIIVFGYMMPILLVLTLITNSLVILVLSQRHMRTPTNIVLLVMAVVDLLTILLPSPWYIRLYTFGGYDTLFEPPELCYVILFMTDVIPVILHTMSIWLALLLAGQRYVYVCHPTLARTWCTVRNVRHVKLLMQNGKTMFACHVLIAQWVEALSEQGYFIAYFTFRILFVFLIPCVMLITLNCLLFRALKKAENKRTELLRTKFRLVGAEPCSVLGQNTIINRSSFNVNDTQFNIADDNEPSGLIISYDKRLNSPLNEQNNYATLHCNNNNRISAPKRPSNSCAEDKIHRSDKNDQYIEYNGRPKKRVIPSNQKNQLSGANEDGLSCAELQHHHNHSGGKLQRHRYQVCRTTSPDSMNQAPNSRLEPAQSDISIVAATNPTYRQKADSLASKDQATGYQNKNDLINQQDCTLDHESEDTFSGSCSSSSSSSSSMIDLEEADYYNNVAIHKPTSNNRAQINDDADYDFDDENQPSISRDNEFTCSECEVCQNERFDCKKCRDIAGKQPTDCKVAARLHQLVSQSSSLVGGATITNDDSLSFAAFHDSSSTKCFVPDDLLNVVDKELTKSPTSNNKMKTGSGIIKDKEDGQASGSLHRLASHEDNFLGSSFESAKANKGGQQTASKTNACKNCCQSMGCNDRLKFNQKMSCNEKEVKKTISSGLNEHIKASDSKVHQLSENRALCISESHIDRVSEISGPLAGNQYECRLLDSRTSQAKTESDRNDASMLVMVNSSSLVQSQSSSNGNIEKVTPCTSNTTNTTTTTLYSAKTSSFGTLLNTNQQQQQQPHLNQYNDHQHHQKQSPKLSIQDSRLMISGQSGSKMAETETSFGLDKGSRVTLTGQPSGNILKPVNLTGGFTSAVATTHSFRTMDSNRTTLMLIVVVTVFLIVEVPTAVTYTLHVVSNAFGVLDNPEFNTLILYMKLFTNLLIMVSYSVNFTIYCSMSRKFRKTFRDLFLCRNRIRCKRPNRLL